MGRKILWMIFNHNKIRLNVTHNWPVMVSMHAAETLRVAWAQNDWPERNLFSAIYDRYSSRRSAATCPNIAAAAQILPLLSKYCRCCAAIFHKSGAKRLFQEQGADKHRTGPKKCVAIQLFQIWLYGFLSWILLCHHYNTLYYPS